MRSIVTGLTGGGYGTPGYMPERKGYRNIAMRASPTDTKPRESVAANFPDVGDYHIGIDIKHTFDNASNQIGGNVVVEFSELPQVQDLRVFLYIIQDGIVDSQSNAYQFNQNYPELKGAGIKIPDYVHRYVFRDEALAGSVHGVPLTNGSIETGVKYSVPINYTLQSSYKSISVDKNNIYLVAAIFANGGEIYNGDRNHLLDDATMIATPAGINQKNASIRLTKGYLIINANISEPYRVKGYSLNGREIFSSKWMTGNSNITPLMKTLSTSIILFQLETSKGNVYSQKLIQQF